MIWTFLLLLLDVFFIVMLVKGFRGLFRDAETGEIETSFLLAFVCLFVSEILLWLPPEFNKGQIASFVLNSVSSLVAIYIIIVAVRFLKSPGNQQAEEATILECLAVLVLVICKLVSVIITLINLYIPTGILFFWLN